jgi:hypothetical protein
VPVKAKRVVYTPLQKTNAISAVSSVTGSFESKAKVLRRVPGYEKVTGQMLAGWATPTVGKKRGRSRRDCFERDVLDQMIYTTLEEVDDPDRVAVLANVAHSYEVIKFAAQKVQKMPEYLQDEKVQALQFSRCWIHDFLAHASLRKRKVTTADKPLPSVEDVQTCMAGIHASRKNYLPGEAVSADETAVLYGLPPSHQYVPEGARRGSAAHGDEKSRYTSMQMGDDDGEMAASFNIIKCSPKTPDLSNTRVLQTLHKTHGFTAAQGWKLDMWSRELSLLDKKKQPFTCTYTRPYLIHSASGIIITIQHKAWMDTAGICMWIDLLIGPHFARKRGKGLLIWDNCGSHCVPCVLSLLVAWGIEEKKLPPNMTGKLQVMDLVVNGPYKSAVRRKRCYMLFDYCQTWKIRRLQELAKPEGDRDLPAFSPPKVDLPTGLLTSFAVELELFGSASFKSSLKRTFIAAGQAPGANGKYAVYSTHARSTIAAILLPQGKTSEAGFAALIGAADATAIEEDDEPISDDSDAEA